MQTWGLQREVEKAKPYPAVLVAGYLLHVCKRDGEWEVWLNPEYAEFTGLCVGAGRTRAEAVAEAACVFEAIATRLRSRA